MTQCAKIIVGFMANVGNVFLSNVYKRFFLIFSTFFTFFNVFYFHLNVYYIYALHSRTPSQLEARPSYWTTRKQWAVELHCTPQALISASC